jgi:aspartate aminotransferase-like enzyme
MTHSSAAARPRRLLAVGGPSTPDDQVLLTLTTPLIGQFDPAFTSIMDEVMQLGRAALVTRNARCFPITALPSAGLEALLNTLVQDGDRVRVVGSSGFRESVADIVVRCGGKPAEPGAFTVAPHVDPHTGEALPLATMATECHARNSLLLVDATWSLGGRELRTDDWQLDAVVAGVDYCLGAPSGMTLVTYSDAVEYAMHARTTPPRTSYLDLLQLQAYWSPERLNHHTAPTSLVYGVHEALRMVVEESTEARWTRHAEVTRMLRDGLDVLGLEPRGDGPLLLVPVPDGDSRRTRLREEHGIAVTATADGVWRVALLGADAQPHVCSALLSAIAAVLRSR